MAHKEKWAIGTIASDFLDCGREKTNNYPQWDTVDVYGVALEEALRTNDRYTIAKIASVFYSRMTWSDHLPSYPDSAEITGDGEMLISFGRLVLECKSRRNEWHLRDVSFETGVKGEHDAIRISRSTYEKEEDVARTTTEKVHIVDCLKQPFPYLQGLFDALSLQQAGKVLIEDSNRKIGEYQLKEASLVAPSFFDHSFRVTAREHAEAMASLEEVKRQVHEEKRKLARLKASPRRIEKCSVQASWCEYPPVPEWRMPHSIAVCEFKGTSGIYVAYEGEQVAYVGRARCIGSRLSSHHKVTPAHMISVVKMPNSETHIAELFYIATLRPPLNSQAMKAEGGIKVESK